MAFCWNCGKEIEYDIEEEFSKKRTQDIIYHREINFLEKPLKYISKRIYCDDCLPKVKEDFKEVKRIYVEKKIKIQIETAIVILERQKLDIYKYKEAINDVTEYALENPSKFDSSDEVIAAIILVHNHIRAKPQFKIGRYRVDFYLPELKCILEIDGHLHNYSALKDCKRDMMIREALGADWEIVRIPTKQLEKNAKALPKAIIKLKEAKAKIRKDNNGIIPPHFSKRDKAKSDEIEKIVKRK